MSVYIYMYMCLFRLIAGVIDTSKQIIFHRLLYRVSKGQLTYIHIHIHSYIYHNIHALCIIYHISNILSIYIYIYQVQILMSNSLISKRNYSTPIPKRCESALYFTSKQSTLKPPKELKNYVKSLARDCSACRRRISASRASEITSRWRSRRNRG